MNRDRIESIASLILIALTDEEHDDTFTTASLWPAVRYAIDLRRTVAEISQALRLLAAPGIHRVVLVAVDLYRTAPDIDDALIRLHAS